MIECIRTESTSAEFIQLVSKLDEELNSRYGVKQSFYDKFNKIEECNTVIVAKWETIPVGCGCFRSFSPDSAEVKRMFVDKNYRGMGLSKVILKKLENWAAEKGFSFLLLETGHKQNEAIGLYKTSGYQVTENYGPYIGVETSICMRKKLENRF